MSTTINFPSLLNFHSIEKEICSHEFIQREYISQPYGTCLSCGKTIID